MYRLTYPTKKTTRNYMIWLTFTKNTLIPKLAGNIRTSNVDLTLVNFFTNKTIIAEPLPNDLGDELKQPILKKQKEILTSVKEKINTVLNPGKSEDYDPKLTETDIFSSLGITEEEYYNALSISPDSEYDLHLKRPLDSCFINNYFVAGIKGFAANVDLQPVFNHYKCITYVCSYFTKDETECSQAIINAAKDAKTNNLSVAEGLRKISAAFLSTREVSSQQCVYRCMPELWLEKFSQELYLSVLIYQRKEYVLQNLSKNWMILMMIVQIFSSQILLNATV